MVNSTLGSANNYANTLDLDYASDTLTMTVGREGLGGPDRYGHDTGLAPWPPGGRSGSPIAGVGGTYNNITLTTGRSLAALQDGDEFTFVVKTTWTPPNGPLTIAVDSVAAVDCVHTAAQTVTNWVR